MSMISAVAGTKKNMSQWWSPDGRRWPVSIVAVEPAVVVGVRHPDKHGYSAVQLGYEKMRGEKLEKKGDVKKADLKGSLKYLWEVRLEDESDLKVGDKVMVSDVLEPGDIVSAKGVTKGRGFSGVMKRWGFRGGPKTHGQSDRERAPGSIGQGTDPGRVHKGKKMPGRYGGETKSIKNLVVVKIDNETGEVWLNGPIPGHTNSRVTITKLGKKSRMKLEGDESKKENSIKEKVEFDAKTSADESVEKNKEGEK